MAKREWFIALVNVSGDYAGNPASFQAADITGPYTYEQGKELEKFDEQFPPETYVVILFKPHAPRYRELLKHLESLVDYYNEDSDTA